MQIGLVGGGDIEGAIVKSGGLGFEGLDLELVDVTGKVVATARTDFDGFFLFERVAYGNYTARVTKESAAAAKILTELGVRIVVTPDKSIVRLGSIQVRPQPVLAANAESSAGRKTPTSGDLSTRSECPRHVAACAGAVEKTRTSTAFRPQRPQRCASTSSATTARHEKGG